MDDRLDGSSGESTPPPPEIGGEGEGQRSDGARRSPGGSRAAAANLLADALTPAGGLPAAGPPGVRLVARVYRTPALTFYAAEHTRHGRCMVQLANRELPAEVSERWLSETRQRAGLEDPRLARVLDLGAEPRPWVALGRVKGVTLAELLQREGGPLAPRRAGAIVLELAGVLGRLHALGQGHGDLRPEDVMLVKDQVLLLGFGPPRAVSAAGERLAWPGGPARGAATQAPPEAFRGAGSPASADLYGLAALLFQCVAGRPLRTGDPAEVLAAATRPEPPALPGHLSEPLAAFLARALDPAPEQRFPDAAAFSAALEQALEPPPLQRYGAAVLLLGLLALAGGCALAWWFTS